MGKKQHELPADLERAVQDVLEQRTARNLFLFGQETNSFQDRFGEWYEKIRKRWLQSTREAMRSDRIREDQESQMKLKRYRSELLQLGFEACRMDEVTRHNDGEVRVKGETK